MEKFKQIFQLQNPPLALVLIWMYFLIFLGCLQLLGLQYGFDVWPLGEDRNWLGFMMQAPGKKMVHAFWSNNDRNPLSAWWWYSVSWLIKNFDSGLYIVRKCLDPLLALIIYLLIDQFAHHKAKLFSFSVALIVLFWNFSAYCEQIIWDFLGALGFSLITLLFFCKYVDSDRKQGSYLAISLISYLIAIATYTLQCGAILAIPFIAFFRDKEKLSIKIRMRQAAIETFFFAAIFILYNCIWYTVSRNANTFYKLDWQIFSAQFLLSLKQFFYHSSYTTLTKTAFHDWSFLQIAVVLSGAFLFLFTILYKFSKNVAKSQTKLPLGWMVLLLVAISLPTLIVESTSQIWFPGTRSLMVQQIWQPLLYVTIIFTFLSLIDQVVISTKMSAIIISCLGSVVILLNLNYNHHLVLRTHYQKVLKRGIKHLPIQLGPMPYYLVKLSNNNDADLNTVPVFISVYGNTMFKNPNLSLRFISHIPNPGPYWRVKFNDDTLGALNAGPIGDQRSVSYKDLLILTFDGKKVRIPKVVTKEDFKGLEVDWLRNEPLDQSKFHHIKS